MSWGSIPAWAGEPRHCLRSEPYSRVDPRVGGGASQRHRRIGARPGRSPRGRGSLSPPCLPAYRVGSIPAWAGEPSIVFTARVCPGVDPRVGGGARRSPLRPLHPRGRSPRGRGSHVRSAFDVAAAGSIPAWAGEPEPKPGWARRARVDPRVGGGASGGAKQKERRRGRSPRGRGSRDKVIVKQRGLGSIPAWAGEPRADQGFVEACGVDPRVGGGASPKQAKSTGLSGRSPRGRGSLVEFPVGEFRQRSIPAWAGEPIRPCGLPWPAWVDPRVGGGASSPTPYPAPDLGRSPRGRGSLLRARPAVDMPRSIPAWAGEPRSYDLPRPRGGVDPRVGGGASTFQKILMTVLGRSPRGRGSRAADNHYPTMIGSIPAWAGEPRWPSRDMMMVRVDPRVGGGARKTVAETMPCGGRSPRGRGSHPLRLFSE